MNKTLTSIVQSAHPSLNFTTTPDGANQQDQVVDVRSTVAPSEQLWVIDAVKVGLKSVQYYTDATRIAAYKLGLVGTELSDSWRRQQSEIVNQDLPQVIHIASSIVKATDYQGSSQKLVTAIKVTAQVNEQLAEGATLTTSEQAGISRQHGLKTSLSSLPLPHDETR